MKPDPHNWPYDESHVDPGPEWGTPEAGEIMRKAAAEAREWKRINEQSKRKEAA